MFIVGSFLSSEKSCHAKGPGRFLRRSISLRAVWFDVSADAKTLNPSSLIIQFRRLKDRGKPFIRSPKMCFKNVKTDK